MVLQHLKQLKIKYMSFLKLQKQIENQFQELVKTGKLFRVNTSGKELWDLYLNSFDEHPI